MQIRCGIDIIEVKRIQESIEKLGERFLQKVFTQKEIQYCKNKKNMQYQHFAARFAAKEAVYKAISEKLENKYEVTWKNIEIENDINGRPYVNLKEIKIKEIESIDISLSHLKEYAVANCSILLKEHKEEENR